MSIRGGIRSLFKSNKRIHIMHENTVSNRLIKLSLLTLFISSTALADPYVSTVNPIANTLIINGSAFGIKTTPAPLVNDIFNSGTTGTSPAGWTRTNGTTGTYNATQYRTGTKSLYFDLHVPTSNGFVGGRLTKDLTPQSQIYVSAWVYINDSFTVTADNSGSAQWKGWRMSNNTDGYTQSAPYAGWYNDNWYKIDGSWSNTFFCGNTCAPSAPADQFLKGRWQRVEQYVVASSTSTTSDGIFWMRRVGRANNISSSTTLQLSPTWRYFSIGVGGQRQQEILDVYYDSIYVDKTQARVELCDTSTWSARTHCEIQPPTAWANDGSQITVNYNPGSFTNGQTAYVYVVDSNGAVSNGKSIIINSTGSTLRPPTNPIGKIKTTTP